MNEKAINTIVEAAIKDTGKTAVSEAVNKLLSETVSVGDSVAVVDDESATLSGHIGKGKVKSLGANGLSGFAQVELPNGTVVDCQTSLLVPV